MCLNLWLQVASLSGMQNVLNISYWKITWADDDVPKEGDVEVQEPDMDHTNTDINQETVTVDSETDLGEDKDSCSLSTGGRLVKR